MIATFPSNAERLAQRVVAFNRRPGARVGDYIRLPRVHPKLGEITRITHDHGDKLQTGGMGGSFYFSPRGFLSYSGSLDPGVGTTQLLPTEETRDGPVWFFDEDRSGAGRGVYFSAPMRVFTLRDGVDLSGIGELRCPYFLACLDAERHAQTCGYWYTISRDAISHSAFATREELMAWLANNGLELTRELREHGKLDCQNLKYSTP